MEYNKVIQIDWKLLAGLNMDLFKTRNVYQPPIGNEIKFDVKQHLDSKIIKFVWKSGHLSKRLKKVFWLKSNKKTIKINFSINYCYFRQRRILKFYPKE